MYSDEQFEDHVNRVNAPGCRDRRGSDFRIGLGCSDFMLLQYSAMSSELPRRASPIMIFTAEPISCFLSWKKQWISGILSLVAEGSPRARPGHMLAPGPDHAKVRYLNISTEYRSIAVASVALRGTGNLLAHLETGQGTCW